MRANAASRLVGVLEAVTEQKSAATVDQVWAGVFAVDPKATGELLNGLSDVLHLLSDAKATVRSVVGEENLKLHMGSFSRLESTFSKINFGANPKTLMQDVTEALQGLRFSADLVWRLGSAGIIDEEVLGKLLQEIDKQLDTIHSSSLDDRAKGIIHDRLVALREAAEQIRFFGVEGFEASLDSVVGAAVRCAPEEGDPGRKKVLNSLAKVVDLALKLIAVAEKVPVLPDVAKKLLGAG